MRTARYTVMMRAFQTHSPIAEWMTAIGATDLSLDYKDTGKNTCIIETGETMETSLEPLVAVLERTGAPYVIRQRTSDGEEKWRQGGRVDPVLTSVVNRYREGKI